MESTEPFFVRNKQLLIWFLIAVELFNCLTAVTLPFSWLRLFNVFLLPVGISVGWRFMYKNYTGWFIYYVGIHISLSTDAIIENFDSDAQVDAAIAKWLEATGIYWYQKTGTYDYFFLRKKDAAQFKLAWA